VIFNAIIIPLLIPIALKGSSTARSAPAPCSGATCCYYGVGGVIRAVHRHQADRHHDRPVLAMVGII